MPTFKVIMDCSAAIRTNTKSFQNAVVIYSYELIILLSRIHHFNYYKAIVDLSCLEFPAKNIETINNKLDGTNIRTFRELMHRQPLLTNLNDYQEDAVLGHGHSIVWHCAGVYKFPGKLYQFEEFPNLNTKQKESLETITSDLEKKTLLLEIMHKQLNEKKERLKQLKLKQAELEKDLQERQEIEEFKQRILNKTDIIYE